MRWWKKFAGFVAATTLFVLFVAHALSMAKNVYEAPATARQLWRLAMTLMSNMTWIAWAVLAFAAACMMFATSDWWLPFYWRTSKRVTAIKRSLDAGKVPKPAIQLPSKKVEEKRDHVGRINVTEFLKQLMPGATFDKEHEGFLVWDYALALRQAALDGTVQIDGRVTIDTNDDQYLHIKPLRTIAADEWVNLKIDILPYCVKENRNANVFAWREINVDDPNVKVYRDLHFRNIQQAREWAETEWPKFRGETYRKYQEAEREKQKRREADKN